MHVCRDSMSRGMGHSLFHLNPPWCCSGVLECFGSISHSRLNYITASCFCEVLRNREILRRRQMRLFYQHYNSEMIKRALFTKVCIIELPLSCEMQYTEYGFKFEDDKNIEINRNFHQTDKFFFNYSVYNALPMVYASRKAFRKQSRMRKHRYRESGYTVLDFDASRNDCGRL